MLYKALYERGLQVEKSEFHRYETPTGKLIRSFLDGEYQVNQKAIECIMAADKYAQLDWFNELSETTDVLILDRYLSSQIAYGKANGTETDFISNLLEYMPIADFHIFLDLSPDESMKRKGKWGENDKYEGDYKLLARAHENYLQMMKLEEEDDKAVILDASLSVEELHQSILGRTLELLESKGVL